MAFRGNVTELATIADRSNHSFQSRVAKNSILEFPVFRFIGGPFLVRNFGPIFFLSRLLNGTQVVFLSKIEFRFHQTILKFSFRLLRKEIGWDKIERIISSTVRLIEWTSIEEKEKRTLSNVIGNFNNSNSNRTFEIFSCDISANSDSLLSHYASVHVYLFV